MNGFVMSKKIGKGQRFSLELSLQMQLLLPRLAFLVASVEKGFLLFSFVHFFPTQAIAECVSGMLYAGQQLEQGDHQVIYRWKNNQREHSKKS